MATELAESNKEAVTESWDLALEGDVEGFITLYADDVRYEDPSTEIHGIDELTSYYTAWFEAFPDMEFEIEEIVAEGDSVVTYYTARATHEGEFLGIPATGNRFDGDGVTIDRFEDGVVVEEINVWDNLTFVQQLEIDPSEL